MMEEIDIDAMRAAVEGIPVSRSRVENLYMDLRSYLNQAEVMTVKSTVPHVSLQVLEELAYWLYVQQPVMQRRLDLAMLVATQITPGFVIGAVRNPPSTVNVDSDVLASMEDLIRVSKGETLTDQQWQDLITRSGSSDPAVRQWFATTFLNTMSPEQLTDVVAEQIRWAASHPGQTATFTDRINALTAFVDAAHTGEYPVLRSDYDTADLGGMLSAAPDVLAGVTAIQAGDVAGLQSIVDQHRLIDDSGGFGYDPQFSYLFGLSVDPTAVAALVTGLDQTRYDPARFDQVLWDLGGVVSTGVAQMTGDQQSRFTTAWSQVSNASLVPRQPLPGQQVPGQAPTEGVQPRPYVQALSLVIARGDWPDSFLSRMADSYKQAEGDQGVAFWLVPGQSVHDPGGRDPATGGLVSVTDPMWGLWKASVHNPSWFISRYGTGPTHEVDTIAGFRNDPTNMFDTTTTQVPAALDDVFHRGFDQASYTALMGAITTADVYTLLNDGQPSLLHDTTVIANAMLLDDYLAPTMPAWIHAALDTASMLPVADVIADALNAFLYWAEGDMTNAALSAGMIAIPGILDVSAKGTRWMLKGAEFADKVVSPAFRPADLMADLAATGEKYTPDNVLAITKTPDGQLVWLEYGKLDAGYLHILDRHAADFQKQGISPTEIPDYLMTAVSQGKIVDTQGKKVPPRYIYEFTYKGQTHRVAIDVGSNGFIVGANPRSHQ